MKKLRSAYILVMLLSMSSLAIYAQAPANMIIKGYLTDSEREALGSEECLVDFTILSLNGDKLFQHSFEVTTNDQGTFSLIIDENLDKISSSFKTLEFAFTLKPSDGNTWMKGEKFSTSYYLHRKEAGQFEVERFEKKILKSAHKNNSWVFADEYPMGYLSFVYMISFEDTHSDMEQLHNTCVKLIEQYDLPVPTPALKSRGIKGGFAVGGYTRN